ncbi:hypothetical protein MBLNU457_5637t1 [Dothideomycetes sp. NU457]
MVNTIVDTVKEHNPAMGHDSDLMQFDDYPCSDGADAANQSNDATPQHEPTLTVEETDETIEQEEATRDEEEGEEDEDGDNDSVDAELLEMLGDDSDEDAYDPDADQDVAGDDDHDNLETRRNSESERHNLSPQGPRRPVVPDSPDPIVKKLRDLYFLPESKLSVLS